eukprot:scaffold4623_cov142-Skeletonema_menzelii.AAC.6
MSSPPENPFSSTNADSDSNRFDAFQLSPEKSSSRSSLPSLQSIQAAQQQQQQQQVSSRPQQQSLTFDSLPSPDELQGPINSTTNSASSNNDWVPSSSSTGRNPNNNNINSSSSSNDNSNQQSSSFLPSFLTCGGALSIESLRPYFDVDTADLVLRMKSSIKYCNVPDGFRNEVLYSDNAMRLAYRETGGGTSGETSGGGGGSDVTSVGNVTGGEGKGPDLYGPTWITMTLVFFLAVTSNMSLYFHHTGKQQSLVDEGGIAAEEEWDYDINQLLHATWILYSYSFGLPIGFLYPYHLDMCRTSELVAMAIIMYIHGYFGNVGIKECDWSNIGKWRRWRGNGTGKEWGVPAGIPPIIFFAFLQSFET